jgi:DeoR/GlpR family transcriptional regulator of sugar metabolism
LFAGGFDLSLHLMQERRSYIEKRLAAEGSIRVAELARLFGVSSETIRKDLLFLEEKGLAVKAYGGALALGGASEPSFTEKSVTHIEEKKRIAQAALMSIESGMSLILDSGSTLFILAQALAIKKDITVFTNGLKAAQLLDEYGITTYVLGGQVRHNSNAIVGSWAKRSLSEIRVDLTVLGTSGFRDRGGPCVENFVEAELKCAMRDAGNRVIVLGDSSKAQAQAVIEFADWSDIDELITDHNIGSDVLEKIKEKTTVTVV